MIIAYCKKKKKRCCKRKQRNAGRFVSANEGCIKKFFFKKSPGKSDHFHLASVKN